MIERIHLRIIQALAESGTLTAAAEVLCLTQPALSHQMHYLQDKLGTELWQKQGRKLRLTASGELLLGLARQVLPILEQAEGTIKSYAEGRHGVLRIGVECHPCYEWLKAVLGNYLALMPKMDVDVVDKFQFSGLDGLINHHIDILVTPDKFAHDNLIYEPLFDYELVLLIANDHSLSKQKFVKPVDLSSELLLTFPVPAERLDIYTQFLIPAMVSPNNKHIASLEIMVQMVALGRAVTVLPDWLAKRYEQDLSVKQCRLGKSGVTKTLYAAMRAEEKSIPYIQSFVELAQRGGL